MIVEASFDPRHCEGHSLLQAGEPSSPVRLFWCCSLTLQTRLWSRLLPDVTICTHTADCMRLHINITGLQVTSGLMMLR